MTKHNMIKQLCGVGGLVWMGAISTRADGLVSYNGTNVVFNADAVVSPVVDSVVTGVTACALLYVILAGVAYVLRILRGGGGSGGFTADDHLTDEEFAAARAKRKAEDLDPGF
jgi:hypothetical protein